LGAPVVELVEVVKSYQRGRVEVRALDGVTLLVEPGEMLAVAGPSGSGKSTLLHIMGLLDRPTSGVTRIMGRETTSLANRERARLRNRAIGFVFQSFHLLPRLTALGNVSLPLLYGGMSRRRAGERAAEALEVVGLSARSEHKPRELSGGESQRVAIARAVVTRPDVVLADEPTGNLDRKTGREVLAVLEKLNSEQNATIVVVTHDPEVAALCSRRFQLRDGKEERGG